MLTLKRLSVHKRMSEETTAFNADVYWKGKFIGPAENTGKGGCTHIRPGGDHAAYTEAQAWARTQPMMLDGKQATAHGGELMFLTLDEAVDEVVYRESSLKELRRLLKAKTVFVQADKPGYFAYKAAFTPELEARIKADHPGATILNALPEEQALKIFMEQC
jgi:hypothetical protein